MKARLGPQYARLWTASTISSIGDGVTLAAMPLLAASLTREPETIALVTLFATLPWLLFSLITGALADRFDRRLIMGGTDVVRCLILGGLGAIVLAGWESIPLLCVVAFVLGTAECLFDNTSLAILPMVVEPSALESANSRLYAASLVTNEFVGPPFGALLFAWVAAAPFLLDAGSFAIAAALVLMLHGTFRVTARPRARLRTEIGEGLRYLRRHVLLRTLAIALGIMNFLEAGMLAIFVLYALEVLHLTRTEYGLLLAAGAFGAVIGSLIAPWMSKRLGPGRMLLCCALGFGATALVPAVWANAFAVGVSSAVSFGFGIAWNVVTISLRQELVPPELLGRVASAYRVVGLGPKPLGAALGGALAAAFGLRAPFFLAFGVTIVAGLALVPWVNNRTVAAARAAGRVPDRDDARDEGVGDRRA